MRMTPLCGNEWDLMESALCCRKLLVNDMPLSSSPSRASPPILQAREITREQTAQNFTQRREESAQPQSQPSLAKLSLLLCLLFADSLQMLVQTCSNTPTDQVGDSCTCVTEMLEGSLETSPI